LIKDENDPFKIDVHHARRLKEGHPWSFKKFQWRQKKISSFW